ncbi:type IV secretory system conjugative DNA transfer family protein [Cytobacillus pseudoceanisediminis]|uniref:type IV secretory system conjugative DNA transfer family protein n=1 Tax=Cytobacillus pseudoceanisediminis TaxID=3051614 RepID=UPI00365BEF5F
MNKSEAVKQKTPFLLTTLLFVTSLYFLTRIWVKVVSLIMGQIKDEEILYGGGFFGSHVSIYLWTVLFASVLAAFTWLLSTRISFYQKKALRIVMFLTVVLTIWGGLALYGMSQVQKYVIPFFQGKLQNVIETDGFFESIVFKQADGFYLILLLVPVLVLFFVSFFLVNKYIEFDTELKEAFYEFQWNGKWLQKLSKLEQKEIWPDVELGANTKTNEMVVLPGRDRTLNTIIIGSIGTGKTAALALPKIKTDLDHMARFINDYPSIYQRDDFETEDVGGRYLNGISIIEPSNDLCQKALKLVKAHGIPDEAITYINPLDPNTPCINPMRGPVDKVAEVFTQVIAGLNDSGDGGSFFFEQAQRSHLKQHIYLLKLHEPGQDVTFDMLLDMYSNTQVVRKMHLKLKNTIPTDIDSIEDRDERNYWKIVEKTDEWFDNNLLPKKDKQGFTERDDTGEVIYFDAQAEYVKGLRNILDDIGANPLIRRVLFGKSDFDFDRHMAVGGVLLVNTAKGELVNLARVLGKIVLMNLQNATFRRKPIVSPFHHILVDEAPDYLYNAFREFPAQSRKYKVIITTLQQTIAQLADQFGEHYMTTLIGTMRNRMVYGDVPGFDANYFSTMFGEKYVFSEGRTEQSVSPLQDSPVSRSGSSYQKVREQAMTSGEIMFQDAFQCAVKIVAHNKPMPVVQIKANFVPKEEFEQAEFPVNHDSLPIWLEERRNFTLEAPQNSNELLIEPIQSIEQTELENEEIYKMEQKQAFPIDEEMVEKVLSIQADPRPRKPVNYTPFMPPATPLHKETKREVAAATLTEELEVDSSNIPKHKDYVPSEVPKEAEDFADSLASSLIEEFND